MNKSNTFKSTTALSSSSITNIKNRRILNAFHSRLEHNKNPSNCNNSISNINFLNSFNKLNATNSNNSMNSFQSAFSFPRYVH